VGEKDPEAETDKTFGHEIQNIIHDIFSHFIQHIDNSVHGPHDKIESENQITCGVEFGRIDIEAEDEAKDDEKRDKADKVGDVSRQCARFT